MLLSGTSVEVREISGCVASGAGQGVLFTRLDWARRQFIECLGIDPYPGTLNLVLKTSRDHDNWVRLKAGNPTATITPTDPSWCLARAYPVSIEGRMPGAIVLPNVSGYPEAQIEVISALMIRREFGLKDGDNVTLKISGPISARAVIFDADGTLVDSIEAYRIVAERAAAPHGIPVQLEAVRRALNTGLPFWDMLIPAGRANREEFVRRLKDDAARLWPEVLRASGRPFPGLRKTLENLKGRKFRLGIVTGSHGVALQLLEEANLMQYFSAVISGDEVRRRKPHPEGLLACVEAVEVRPNEAVYVGDTSLDVQASRAAGMFSVAVLSGAADCAQLTAAGPDRIIHSHARLPEILA